MCSDQGWTNSPELGIWCYEKPGSASETSGLVGGSNDTKDTVDCANLLESCREEDAYPNIGQGFRGYNVIKGDPLATDGDPGYQAHIFDEEPERAGLVRFGNTAGSDLNRCNGNVKADFIGTSEEFFSSVTETKGTQNGYHVGPEMEISGSFGKDGVEASASRDIPPIYQSMASNSKIMMDTMTNMNSQETKTTRSRFNCYEYEFEIKEAQHPQLRQEFENEVAKLDVNLASLADYSDKTEDHDRAVKFFFEQFGTHYIKSARFGSTMSVITVLDKKAEYSGSHHNLEECSTENSKWSFLGLFGGGKVSNKCKGSVFDEDSSANKLVVDSSVMLVGSRPAATYDEWAQNNLGSPEIIHKTVAPISELLTKNFLTKLGEDRFDSDGVAKIKTLLDHFTLDYCRLFPSDCTYVFKRPYCQSKDNTNKYESCSCDETQSNCGHYTGYINENFLPNGEGIMHIGKKYIRSTKWNNGVLEGESTPPAFEIPREQCRWKGADHLNTLLRCDGNEIAVGVCSGGRKTDCGGKYHEIQCCAVPAFTSSKCEVKNAHGWGDPLNCRTGTTTNGNILMSGACASGGTRDCHGEAQQAECCKGTLNNGAETLGVPDSNTCKWKYSPNWGDRLECDGKNEAAVGHCGSGNRRDCPNRNVHGLLCCQVDVI